MEIISQAEENLRPWVWAGMWLGGCVWCPLISKWRVAAFADIERVSILLGKVRILAFCPIKVRNGNGQILVHLVQGAAKGVRCMMLCRPNEY